MSEVKHAGHAPADKRLSLYPHTLEEVADRLLATPRRRAKKAASSKSKSKAR